MSKEIRFSAHALSKISLLNDRGITISEEFVIQTIRSPDQLEIDQEKITAQKQLNDSLVLRVIYREFQAFILVITLYPGKRSRYEN